MAQFPCKTNEGYNVPSVRKSVLAAILVSATALSPLGRLRGNHYSARFQRPTRTIPQLNSARAGVRVTDEGVAIAKSGWRPTITGSASIDYSSSHLNARGMSARTRACG